MINGFNVINKVCNITECNRTLQRQSDYENKQIKLSNTILNKNETAKQIEHRFKKYIIKFVQTLISKNANFDFHLFLKNINDLNIVVLNDEEMDSGGEYAWHNNVIYIREDYLSKVENIIFHELFHMASYNRFKACGGFQDFMLYRGINEGYTQLLSEKYFSFATNDYSVEKAIAKLLECIIDSTLIEKFYSTANPKGLLNEISKYNGNDLNKARFLLKKIDDYQKIINLPSKEFNEKSEECCKIIKSIMIDLIEMFINKLKNENINSDIDEFFNNIIVTIGFNHEDQIHIILSSEELSKYKKLCYEISENRKKH